jgi:glutamate N-acetyltransferase/amino-acid N-acetyltransferase
LAGKDDKHHDNIIMNESHTIANHEIPVGFSMAGVHAGVKRSASKRDLTLVVCQQPTVGVGVYTQNVVCAAPVILDRARTPSDNIRAVVINSGNANACTGDRGMEDARTMARVTADSCGVPEPSVLVMSTGIIGETLPIDRISAGIRDAASQLGSSSASLLAAAEGILTTDNGVKIASRRVAVGNRSALVTGIAKGAGMIAPNMATMLGLILTDLTVSRSLATELFRRVTERSFNATSVDGHTSTNDTALLLASGQSGIDVGDDAQILEMPLQEVCAELSMAIASDGEGATHLIEIQVVGCKTDADAKTIARTIANSPLVKTAVAGADPNWGRIVSAAGYAGPNFDPAGMSLTLNGVVIFKAGQPQPFDASALSDSISSHRRTRLRLALSEGNGKADFWTSDLTAEYVRINAEYHT